MTTFIIQGLSIWTKNPDAASPPHLEKSELLNWFEESGVVYHLIWVRDAINDITYDIPCYQTGVVIEDPKHAILFKLRWGSSVDGIELCII